jgi:uncharacterized membrane protein YoaK (UPF0700 family)
METTLGSPMALRARGTGLPSGSTADDRLERHASGVETSKERTDAHDEDSAISWGVDHRAPNVPVEREDPDLPRSPDGSTGRRSWRLNRARTPAITDNDAAEPTPNGQTVRDVLLVGLTVASGAVDAISYFGLGKIFSAFMTGNIVFLGFGIANLEGPCLPVVLALSTFAVGAYLGLRIATLRARDPGSWPHRMSVLVALVAIAEASFLAVWSATAGHPSTEIIDVLIVLFSLAMGIQTAAVRSLGVQGVFTTAGTFTLVAFAATFAGSRPRGEMPRLFGVLLGLIAGAIGGGLLFVHARSYAPVLPLVITILVILIGWTMHRSPQRPPAAPDPRPTSSSAA